MNGIFFPMLIYGLAGVNRRLYDPTGYAHASAVHQLSIITSYSAWVLGVAQIPFILNFFRSAFKGEKTRENPWEATTLEWAAPSPPPHGNFVKPPTVYRGPYEYNVPGAKTEFSPQHVA
jgi:cytochrome c oxidase subunit 1